LGLFHARIGGLRLLQRIDNNDASIDAWKEHAELYHGHPVNLSLFTDPAAGPGASVNRCSLRERHRGLSEGVRGGVVVVRGIVTVRSRPFDLVERRAARVSRAAGRSSAWYCLDVAPRISLNLPLIGRDFTSRRDNRDNIELLRVIAPPGRWRTRAIFFACGALPASSSQPAAQYAHVC
jgi:hypothetical protein